MNQNKIKVPKISVIVPVYNTENFIEDCINSILNQTFTDFELILIDDGSTDSSSYICKEYSKKDNRISLIRTPNRGVSNARNTALNIMKGEYVCFIDSDDTIEINYLIKFVDNLSIEANLYIQQMNIIERTGQHKLVTYKLTGLQNIINAIRYNNLCGHGYACGKLFNSSLIKEYNLQFDNQIKFSEDLIFVLQYIQYTNKIYYVEFSGYNYYFNTGNASSKIYSIDSELHCYKCYKDIINRLSEEYEYNLLSILNVTEIYAMLFARVRNSIYNNLSNESAKDRLSFFKELSNEEKSLIYQNKHISNFIIRIAYWLLINNRYRIFDFLLKNSFLIHKKKLK